MAILLSLLMGHGGQLLPDQRSLNFEICTLVYSTWLIIWKVLIDAGRGTVLKSGYLTYNGFPSYSGSKTLQGP